MAMAYLTPKVEHRLALAGAAATFILGGSVMGLGIAALVYVFISLSNGEARVGFLSVVFVLVVLSGVIGVSGLSFLFGLTALWNFLVAAIVRRHELRRP